MFCHPGLWRRFCHLRRRCELGKKGVAIYRTPPLYPACKHTKSYRKWPCIVDFPIKNGWIFDCYVSSPEGTCFFIFVHFDQFSQRILPWWHLRSPKPQTLQVGCARDCWIWSLPNRSPKAKAAMNDEGDWVALNPMTQPTIIDYA
jgi:hypothetical protein